MAEGTLGCRRGAQPREWPVMDPSTGGAGLKRSAAFGQRRPPVGGTSRLVEN